MCPLLRKLALVLLVVLHPSYLPAQSAPAITGLSPSSGAVGAAVAITGTSFGATQGSSTVTFNGVAATPTSWSDTAITVPVPNGATTGNVVVTVNSSASNGVSFTVYPGSFGPTGSLNTARWGPLATLLNSGKVLIVGGYDAGEYPLASIELYDPATGSFTTVRNTGPAYGAATLLANGKVLLAGAVDSNGNPVASAELYDPATGTFTATGSLNTARGGPTATLLANGKVLVACGDSLGSAELYDPATGTFTMTGSLNTARGAPATRLANGKVLIAGGWSTSWNMLASAELYDPAAGTFTYTGSLNVARVDAYPVLLNNGRVLLAAGAGTTGALTSGDLYDPAAGTFTLTSSLGAAHDGQTETLLTNGRVLIAGGDSLGYAELYDPATGMFAATGNLGTARGAATAVRLNNGKVLIVGGFDSNGNLLASAELYTPSALVPAGLVSITVTPQNPTIVAGTGQQFVATGTFSDHTETLQSATWSSSATSVATISNDAGNHGYAFGLTAGTTTISACAGSVCGSTGLTVGPPVPVIISLTPDSGPVNSSVLIEGANFGSSQGTSTVAFNGTGATSFASWTDTAITVTVPNGATTGNVVVTVNSTASNGKPFTVGVPGGFAPTGDMNAVRYGPNATLLANGKVLVEGGWGADENPALGAELYDPATGSFSTVSQTTPAIGAMALLANGKVLIAGGWDSSNGALASAYLYDPATGNVTATGNLNTARCCSTATLLNNGKVLIAGGGGNSDALAASELYDPATGTFTATGNLNTARSSHTATLLNNGQVLIVQGADNNGNALASAELYNPATGTFTATGSLNTARVGTATLLNNGRVLITGGYDSSWTPLPSAEVYNPATGSFTATGSLNTARRSHVAVLLNNSSVLIAGGYGNSGVLTSAELYDPATGSFMTTGSLNIARGDPSAARLTNGQVLVASEGTAELYTPSTLTPAGLVSITVTPQNPSIAVGTSQQFAATGTFSDEHTETLQSVTWTSSATSVAFISNDAGNHGKAFGLSAGTTTISACAGSICDNTTLTVTAPPSITSLSLTFGPVGTLLTITGTNFGASQGTSTVTFNGAAATTFANWNDTTIQVTVPLGATTGNVVVTVNGAASNGVPFTVIPTPSITGLSPNSGSIGTSVTISGANFGGSQGSSTVTFNEVAASPASWSDTSIGVAVPTGATSGYVVVTVNGIASNAVSFTVPPPYITSLTPNQGPGSTLVAIVGTAFGTPQGNSTVTFNGTAATILDWSDTDITARVPVGATTGNVVVTVAGTASNGVTFTVPPSAGTTVLTDSMNRTTSYAYQNIAGRNFLTAIAGSGCASCGGRGNAAMTYDPLGNMESSTDALNHTTTYTYDSMGNVLTKTQYLNPSTPLTWTYTYNSFQEVLTATDPAGNVTTNVYDAHGNLLSTTTPPPSGTGSGLTTTFQYDSKGELIQVTDPKGNSTTLTYTTAGLVASITDAQNNTTTFTYDARGNRLTSTDALNHTTTYTYDSMNRLTRITAPDNTYTQFGYDYRGRRTSVTDANGKTTTYQYDDADRLMAVTDAAQNVTAYGYDTENNLVDITDAANHQTSFAYDALGRVTQVTFPSTHTESYTYDAMNNLLTKTDRKSQTINYGYDALYRLTSKTYPDSTAVNYTYDALSRLTQVADPSGTYSFTYDNVERLVGTGTQYSFLTGTLANSYTYDAASNRTSMTDPQSGTTSYGYDTLNRLTSLTDPNSAEFGFGYDALGRRTSLTRPNNVDTAYSYDSLSRLLSVLHNGGYLPGSTSYTYDAAGNRTSKTALQQADPTPVSVLSQYSYDNIYQLTQTLVDQSLAESYTYDAVGNRLTSLNPASYTYNSSNQLTATSAATYTYDYNGNTLTKTDTNRTTYYTWDYENRLTQVTLPSEGGTVYFSYDPFGRRIRKVFGSATTIYAYEGDNVIEELNASGNLVASYTQGTGIDQPLAMYRGLTTAYFHADGLGSVTSLTDGAGNVSASYVYDSFGKLAASTGSLTNPFQYTGREFDAETGLYYYRARYYDPAGGRFLGEDPIRFVGGHNFYTYVGNDPTVLTDPSGRDKICNVPAIGPHSKLPTPIDTCASNSLVDCVIEAESGGNANAVSTKGAKGLMQTTPAAINELKQQGLYQKGMSDKELGTAYLNLLLTYCDNVTDALAAYNAGPSAVNKAGGVPQNGETEVYVPKIDKCLKGKGLQGGAEDSSATTSCCKK